MGSLVGLVNGLIVTVFKINALITTLAMSFVIGGIALKVSGGNLIVLSPTSGFFKFANAQFLTVPSAVWMTLVFIVVLGLLLSRTTFGRYMVASGGNAEAARLAGVRVNLIRVVTFILSGGAAGLGGVIDISRLLSAQAGERRQRPRLHGARGHRGRRHVDRRRRGLGAGARRSACSSSRSSATGSTCSASTRSTSRSSSG